MEPILQQLITPLGNQEDTHLTDESKFQGQGESLSTPTTLEELSALLAHYHKVGEQVTIQGSLTGITGAAVPAKGHILDMKSLNSIEVIPKEEGFWVTVQGGAKAEEVEKVLRQETKNSHMLPCLPTEKTATIGGILASGGKGLQSYGYGCLQDYTKELQICRADGTMEILSQDHPSFGDFFHSEGMLGVIVSATFQTVVKPAQTWGLLFPLSDFDQAIQMSRSIQTMEGMAVVELMDQRTLGIIGEFQPHMNHISALPPLPDWVACVLYVEVEADTEDQMDQRIDGLIQACEEAAGDPDIPWAMCTEEEVARLQAYRHSASECVNMKVAQFNAQDKRIRKISVDIQWQETDPAFWLGEYTPLLEESGLSYCIFGHFGRGGPYVNIIAEDFAQYQAGLTLVEGFMQRGYQQKAVVCGEHGVGKLKKNLFHKVAPVETMNYYMKLKTKWDNEKTFNPENMY